MATETGWSGYLIAGFFALGMAVASVQLLPGSAYLRIDEQAVSFASLFRVTRIPWDDIDEFFVLQVRQTGLTVHQMVAFNRVPSAAPPPVGRQMSAAIAGCDGALPETYGKTADDLADLLNHWLAQYRQKHAPRGGAAATGNESPGDSPAR